VADMTKEVRIFERLKASEERFRNLARQLPAAVFELDADSSIRYCNDFAVELLGIRRPIAGNSLRLFVAADELARYDRLLSEALGGRESGLFSMDLARGSRGRLPALWSLALRRWRDGEPRVSVIMVEVESLLSSVFAHAGTFFAAYGLTERELAVAKLLLSGSIYKEIAFELGISLSTVRTHTMSLYRKLGIHSREELAALVNRWQAGRYGENGFLRKLLSNFPLRASVE